MTFGSSLITIKLLENEIVLDQMLAEKGDV